MWQKFKDRLSKIWGQITTQVLAFLGLVQYIFADPTVASYLGMFKWFPAVLAGVSALAMVLRYFFPPKVVDASSNPTDT